MDPALGPQFQILRKLSQDPVHTAMPSSVTPRQLTRLSWPARTPRNTTKQSLIILIHLLHLSTKTKKNKKIHICYWLLLTFLRTCYGFMFLKTKLIRCQHNLWKHCVLKKFFDEMYQHIWEKDRKLYITLGILFVFL